MLVAHNAQFDNRILTTEFDRLGYNFDKKTLCTVELAKQLMPDMASYSLGKLVQALGIPIVNRHRAGGDALATVELFKLLLLKDAKKEMLQQHIKVNPRRNIDSKLLALIKAAPTDIGVYYMHREDGTIIYIGKSKNIQKRLTQHFTNDNRKSKKIQQEVTAISYEKTGNELIALLKESEDIKQLNPKYNRALRKRAFNAQLTSFVDKKGYINLKIEKVDARKKAITTFSSLQSAKKHLENIIGKYALCQKLGGLQNVDKACFSYEIKECLGACIDKEPPNSYNKKVSEFLNNYSYQNQHMLVIDKGRNTQERSVILIEEGSYRGFGYYTLNHQITNPEILKSIIRPMDNNRDAQHILQSYLRKRKVIKIINLEVNHKS